MGTDMGLSYHSGLRLAPLGLVTLNFLIAVLDEAFFFRIGNTVARKIGEGDPKVQLHLQSAIVPYEGTTEAGH